MPFGGYKIGAPTGTLTFGQTSVLPYASLGPRESLTPLFAFTAWTLHGRLT